MKRRVGGMVGAALKNFGQLRLLAVCLCVVVLLWVSAALTGWLLRPQLTPLFIASAGAEMFRKKGGPLK